MVFARSLDKRPGWALISVVLLSFIVLSIFAMVLFGISMRTLKIQNWQTEHYEELRLSYVARSSTNAVVEAISDDLASLGAFPIDRHGTATVSSMATTTLDIVISGDTSPYLVVKTKASNDKGQAVTVTARYNTITNKVAQWRDSR